jgi:hypothetical protein
MTTLLICAASADARRFHFVGEGTVWADGDRYAAISLKDRPVRVIDDLARRGWSVTSPRPNCHLSGVAARTVMWDCSQATPPLEAPRLQELGTRTLRPVPGWDTYARWFESFRYQLTAPFGPYPAGLGARWVGGAYGCFRCKAGPSFMDWHTGTFVPRVDDVAGRVVDLDDPDLEVPLCAPLQRHVSPYEDDTGSFGFYASAYRSPWFLNDAYAEGSVLKLYRCGHRKAVFTVRCRCHDPVLGRRHLLWLDQYDVRAFDLAKRRRVSLGKLEPVAGPRLYATRHTLYITTYGGYVYAASLPRPST